jgi:DNA-binding IscR family transcriptional regulator
MRLSVKVSLAVHILLVTRFYSDTARVTGRLLSRSTGANPVIVRSITLALKKAGMLAVRRGASGGAELLKPPGEISLWDICEAVDPESVQDFSVCIHEGSSRLCPVGRRIQGALAAPYKRIAKAVQDEMQRITLEEISRGFPPSEIDMHKRSPFFKG